MEVAEVEVEPVSHTRQVELQPEPTDNKSVELLDSPETRRGSEVMDAGEASKAGLEEPPCFGTEEGRSSGGEEALGLRTGVSVAAQLPQTDKRESTAGSSAESTVSTTEGSAQSAVTVSVSPGPKASASSFLGSPGWLRRLSSHTFLPTGLRKKSGSNAPIRRVGGMGNSTGRGSEEVGLKHLGAKEQTDLVSHQLTARAFVDLTSAEPARRKSTVHQEDEAIAHRPATWRAWKGVQAEVESAVVDLCSDDSVSSQVGSKRSVSSFDDSDDSLGSGVEREQHDRSSKTGNGAGSLQFIDLEDPTWFASTARPSRKVAKHDSDQNDDVACITQSHVVLDPGIEDSSLAIVDEVPTSSKGKQQFPSSQVDRLRISSTVVRQFRCPVCLEDIEKGQQVCYFGCEHRLCFDCATQFVLTKVQDAKVTREELICPLPDCKCPLSVSEIRGCLADNEEALNRYEQFSIKRYLEREKDAFFCPTPGCPFVAEASGNSHAEEFTCPACTKKYCLGCRSKWHPGSTCEEAKMFSEASKEDQKFLKKAKRSGMKQCPKCRFWVEKSEGCNAMLCRCGTTFCWRCGDDVNKDSGCSCLTGMNSMSWKDRADVLQINGHATNRNNPAHRQLQQGLMGQNLGLGLVGFAGRGGMGGNGNDFQNPLLAAAYQIQNWNIEAWGRARQQLGIRRERPRERREPWRARR